METKSQTQRVGWASPLHYLLTNFFLSLIQSELLYISLTFATHSVHQYLWVKSRSVTVSHSAACDQRALPALIPRKSPHPLHAPQIQ